jgi:hypothetical protein
MPKVATGTLGQSSARPWKSRAQPPGLLLGCSRCHPTSGPASFLPPMGSGAPGRAWLACLLHTQATIRPSWNRPACPKRQGCQAIDTLWRPPRRGEAGNLLFLPSLLRIPFCHLAPGHLLSHLSARTPSRVRDPHTCKPAGGERGYLLSLSIHSLTSPSIHPSILPSIR